MDYPFKDIRVGSEYSNVYKITDEVYQTFVNVFQDQSPIHVDEGYAKNAGFDGRVMHGAILQGFLSHFIGMRFPGQRSLILSVNLSYRSPSYLGDEITLSAKVGQKVDTAQVVVLLVRFINTETNGVLASGKVQVSVRNE